MLKPSREDVMKSAVCIMETVTSLRSNTVIFVTFGGILT